MTYYPNLQIHLPGTPGAVHAVIESMTTATRELEASAQRLHSALKFAGTWNGAAADSYASAGSDLAPALNSGVQSLAIAGTALEVWVAQLADNQRLAEQWEHQAAVLARQEAVFRGQYQAAFAAIRPGTDAVDYPPSSWEPGIQGETPALRAAHQGWEQADSALNDLRIKAEALAQKHTSQANAAATKVEAAKPNAFEPATHPSLVQSVINDVTSVAGKIAQWSATVTAIAAPIPGVDVIDAVTGPLAAGAGAVHLAGDAEQVITHAPGGSSVLNFVLDAVDMRGGRTAVKEIGGLRQAGRDRSSLTGAAHAHVENKHIAAAGDPTLTRAQQIARGRAAARRPAIAAAAQLPVQAAGGSPLAKDGVGVLIDPSAKSVGALLEDQARSLDQRHNR